MVKVHRVMNVAKGTAACWPFASNTDFYFTPSSQCYASFTASLKEGSRGYVVSFIFSSGVALNLL